MGGQAAVCATPLLVHPRRMHWRTNRQESGRTGKNERTNREERINKNQQNQRVLPGGYVLEE